MAIWQYQIYMIPEEEISSYFKNDKFISYDDFNEIKWWKYRQLNIKSFDLFTDLLPKKDSWSDDIILFGDESSNCIEILKEQDLIIEISIRIDLRLDCKKIINLLCEFTINNNCMFLNDKLEVLHPNVESIKSSIASYPVYKTFLDNFGNK